MAKLNGRRLPVGIQSFQKIRKEGYQYVDKTDIIWNMVNNGDQFVYLSRPRRFGKSVLVDTLQMYLEGRKELFEGLKIMDMEYLLLTVNLKWEWQIATILIHLCI